MSRMQCHLVQLLQQALQRRAALKINNFTGIFVEDQMVLLGIFDIEAILEEEKRK